MKYIKLFENFGEDFLFRIKSICEEYDISNYTINDDGSIDVNGDVNISYSQLSKIPLNFGNVSGDFNCQNNRLTSLKGCPKYVSGNFYCNENRLTSLEFSPELVGADFFCDENRFKSLKGGPKSVNGDFNCSFNQLTSLEFMNKYNGDFNCSNNIIKDFIGFVEPIGKFNCDNNPIISIWKLFRTKEHIELLNDYDCIRGKDIVIDRLNMFLEEIGKDSVSVVFDYNII